MAFWDFQYCKAYSNETSNIEAFLPKIGICFTETVPYSFRKVFQAFHPGSRCNQTSSIRWHVRIFNIPKCIPIKPKILRIFYRKQGFALLKPSHIRCESCSKRSISVADVTRRAFLRHVRILDIPKCITIKLQILRFFYRKQGSPLLKPSHIR